MGLYTSNYLKNLASNKRSFINESKNIFLSKATNEREKFDIFLSHSYLDKDEVNGLYSELTDKGYKVYVDWIVDSHLDRTNVTKESTELIRNRLKHSKSLLLAISSKATMSKWIPWELGYVDGKTNNCAILPIAKESSDEKTFTRSEYLLLYPYVKMASLDGFFNSIYTVDSSNYYIDFSKWIRYDKKPEFNFKNIDIL
ncbi:toll/interleukin-1 receptor domain-containing protein [Tenacibaculum sp. TC6]|uniref:toll/interleukin-1 receptor domain-containing protein n=1 Tax=Tenacibaculum sp. TC6 TaxID=3423223 RepID=UPI003D35CD39